MSIGIRKEDSKALQGKQQKHFDFPTDLTLRATDYLNKIKI